MFKAARRVTESAIEPGSGVPMRVMHVVPTWWPAARYGGPIVSVRALCKALADDDCEVSVCTTNVDGPGVSDVPTDQPWRDGNLSVHSFSSNWGRRLYFSAGMGRFLSRHSNRFDVIHTHSVFLWPTWKAARSARASGVPYVLSPRGMLVPELIKARSAIPKRLWISLIERSNLRHASLIHVTSETERQDLQRLELGSLPPIVVIPNGVVMPENSSETRRKDQIVFIGRISWKKGLDRLLEAVAALAEVRLIVAGPDNEGLSQKLQRQATELGMADRVQFVGPVDTAECNRLLAQSTLLVLPSLSENFGNVVVEAMAAGCPVVTTQGVGASEVLLRAAAGIVCDASVMGISEGIASIMARPQAAHAMGERGRVFCGESLSWSAIARTMRQAYLEAIDGRGRMSC
jgi:glycosyltransferase involved in cell wall biosynthesis